MCLLSTYVKIVNSLTATTGKIAMITMGCRWQDNVKWDDSIRNHFQKKRQMWKMRHSNFHSFSSFADTCSPKDVANGKVQVLNQGVWKVICDRGYTLVGRPVIKCRNNQWSNQWPSCTGMCPSQLIFNLSDSLWQVVYSKHTYYSLLQSSEDATAAIYRTSRMAEK